ncbi:MAG: leucine-rich repeat protein [Oscillospiraceae bacterium]|nr:leucine-rich repeat protein [Oscillospiraceae bacterium]
MRRRISAFLMTLVMCLTLLSAAALADAPKDLSDAEVTLDKSEYTFNGSEIKPKVTVRYDGRTLGAGTDYTVSYADNVKAGSAAVVVTGTGSGFSGAATRTFTIAPIEMDSGSVDVRLVMSRREYGGSYGYYNESMYYTGKAQEPAVIPYYYYYDENSYQQEAPMVEGVDFEVVGYANNVNAGTATVTIAGRGNFTGTRTQEFTVSRMPLEFQHDFVLSYDKAVLYTGKPVSPNISIRWKLTGETLVEGRDYTVTYPDGNNTEVGSNIRATITGIGNFEYDKEVVFDIVEPSAAPPPFVKSERGNYDKGYVAWIIDEKGTLEVSFSGEFSMPASYVDCYWRPFRNMIKKIVVAQGTFYIPAGAFEGCRFVTEVELPEGLSTIQYDAFKDCDSLETMNIPSSLTRFDRDASPKNDRLVLHLPDNITEFDGYGAMENVKALVNPGSVTEATLRAKQGYFYYENYPDFELYDNGDGVLHCVRYVGDGGTVTIPDFVDSIQQVSGFGDTYLINKVVIPANVKKLGSFDRCFGLRELVIQPGSNELELPSYFVHRCNDVTIYLPDNVTGLSSGCIERYMHILLVANSGSRVMTGAMNMESYGSHVWIGDNGSFGNRYTTAHAGGYFDGDTFKATVTAPKDAMLIAARYDASGKLAEIKTVTISSAYSGNEVETGLTKESGCKYKLMLVNKTSFAPLCRAWSGKA